MRTFTCDMCGKQLEHHGERYIMRIESVPAYRTWDSVEDTWDLCRDCAKKFKLKRRRTVETGNGD